MNVLFLYSSELNAEENLARVRSIFPNVISVCARNKSKAQAYRMVANSFNNPHELFMMIEGDNYVFESAIDLLSINTPCKLIAQSPYGFAYEHGGIKILTPNHILRALDRIATDHDISVHLGLPTLARDAASLHAFNTSPWNEFNVAAREIIKLHCWNNQHLLAFWKNTRTYKVLEKHLNSITIKMLLNANEMNKFLSYLFNARYLKIAVIGIMKNEERHIARYVDESMNLGDVFLLDTGSADNSIEIARQHGAIVKCKHFDRVDFSDFRNSALQEFWDTLIEYDYFIFLDIDESLYPTDVVVARDFLGKHKYHGGFSITRQDLSGAPPVLFQRVFSPKTKGIWHYPIHEQYRAEETFPWIECPVSVLHLESELIQEKNKRDKYRAIILKEYDIARKTNNVADEYHYFFFYIDFMIQEGNSNAIIDAYNHVIKDWKDMEFSVWYLRRMFQHFVMSNDITRCNELVEIVKDKYPASYERLTQMLDFYFGENNPYLQDQYSKLITKANIEMPEYVIRQPISFIIELNTLDSSLFYELFNQFASFLSINFEVLNKSFENGRMSFTMSDNIAFFQSYSSKEFYCALLPIFSLAVQNNITRNVYITYGDSNVK